MTSPSQSRPDGRTGLTALWAPQPDMPSDVGISALCWLGVAGLAVINALLGTLQMFTLVGSLPGFAVGPSMIIGLLFQVALIAGFAYVVLLMRAGHAWARILLAVLGGLAALVSLIGALTLLGGDEISLGAAWDRIGMISSVLSLVQVGLIAAGAVFMFRPAASAYFGKIR